MAFDEMIKEATRKHEEASVFVMQTGLCFVCKLNRAEPQQLKCKVCITKTEALLKQL